MPRLAITPKVARRIRELALEAKSQRQIATILESEFGVALPHTTIGRHLKKHPPKPARAKPACSRSRPSSSSSRSQPPHPPIPDADFDELAELLADAVKLRGAIDTADPDSRALPGLVDSHRKILAAIRIAKRVGVRDDEEAAREARQVRERLAAFAPPSPPTFAEQQHDAGPALSDEPGAPGGVRSVGAA